MRKNKKYILNPKRLQDLREKEFKNSPVIQLALQLAKQNAAPSEVRSRIRGFSYHELQSLRERSSSRPQTTVSKGASINQNVLLMRQADTKIKSSVSGLLQRTEKIFPNQKICFPALHYEIAKTRLQRHQRYGSIEGLLKL